MIKSVWFLFKVIILTSLVLCFLQIKVKEKTLEQHLVHWIKTSKGTHHIRKATDAGTVLVNKTSEKTKTFVKNKAKKIMDPEFSNTLTKNDKDKRSSLKNSR